MTANHTVALELEPNPGDIQALVKELVAFNTAQLGGETQQYLVATVRATTNALVGGVFALTYMGWLHVQAVWVHETCGVEATAMLC